MTMVVEMEQHTPDEVLALRQELIEVKQANQILSNGIAEHERREEELLQELGELNQRITEHINALNIASAELTQAVQTRDGFLAMMSHELRTPLNTVLGITEMLQEEIYGSLNKRQLKALRTVETSGRHLLALINDILDLSTIEAGTLKLHCGPVDIEGVAQDSLHALRDVARAKHISVSFKMDYTMTIVQADAPRLKQILVNLLSNAIKFTPEGGQVGIEVMADVERNTVSFRVWDTGVGIAPEHMHRLFKPFVQLDSGLDRQYEGTGLGLVLVSRLTELQGGSVAVESEVGTGSRFTITLPHGSSPQSKVRREHAAASDDAPPLILITDDNEVTIQLLADYLTFKGYRVAVAHNGAEAADQAHREDPALILMDIQMPVLDGLDAIRLIRKDIQIAHIPIIALTSLDMPGHREECLDIGANDYMSKPVSLKTLLSSIETLLQEGKDLL